MRTKEEVCARIRELGLLPSIRVSSSEDALFAAHEVLPCGIDVVEVTMTVPNALAVISELTKSSHQLIVGAGTVLNTETARACVDAGAGFLTSPGFSPELTQFAMRNNIVSIPGALTPSEIMAAWDGGADIVKIFPCSCVGGPAYIKALKAPFQDIPFIASGGVDQATAGAYIRAGAVALGVGSELIPPVALQLHDRNWIRELAGRFLGIVQRTRADFPHSI
jgi:2-dehydro-3-deoxyphosphogluconate aldolase / (4S)-4-hydroxy-2-oxoglutarate aldolase